MEKEPLMSTPFAPARARTRCRAVAALIIPALATACAAGPDYRAPDNAGVAPAAYGVGDDALSMSAPADRWWGPLHDPILDALIAEALAKSPDLASAEAHIRQARALARAAGADFLPAVNASGRVSRDKLSRNGENLALIPFTPPTTQFTDYRVGIDASWEIDLAGHTRREVEAAVAHFGSETESRNDARVVIAAEAASAYIEYRVAAERLELARGALATLDESARLIALQQQAGLASTADVRNAQAERLASADAPAVLDALRIAALQRLFALTGTPATTLASRLAPEAAIPTVPAQTPVGVPSSLLERRPDVRRAERELAAATANVGVAVAAQFPRLSLVGDAGLDSIRSGDLTQAASRYWNLAPQLTLPLFAGGRLRRQSEAAEAARDAALSSYRAIVLRAIADAESAVVRYAGDRRNAASLAAAAAQLEESAGFERTRYAAGDVSMLEVLTAERSANRAADMRSQSSGQSALDFVALQRALGGGWQAAD
jgi:NodT family efflux transporter outer membrane factor (OMF) lipoprotein